MSESYLKKEKLTMQLQRKSTLVADPKVTEVKPSVRALIPRATIVIVEVFEAGMTLSAKVVDIGLGVKRS